MKRNVAGLSEQEKAMFTDFMDWYNLEVKIKTPGTFNINNPKMQSFIISKGLTLDYKSPIPNAVNETNKIVYKSSKSCVEDLARHIRNAFAHSNIKKVKDDFIMKDVNGKATSMRGRVSANLMQDLLNAIRANKQVKKKNNEL